MRVTPTLVTELKPNEIFCYGSNRNGFHGAGAAKLAFDKFGAKWGIGEGLQGQTYAIPTKETPWKTLTIRQIGCYVGAFCYFAEDHPELRFYVTEIGCGLAGYTPNEIAPLFRGAMNLENVWLPEKFWKVLGE